MSCDLTSELHYILKYLRVSLASLLAVLHPITLKRMNEWCKEHIPSNKFAFALYPNKGIMTFADVNSLQNFDRHNAIREFVRHLEKEGFIKHAYSNSYKIVKDRLPIEEFSDIYKKPMFIGVSETAINALSADDQERFQERAGIGIHEFCGAFKKRS